MAFFQYTTWEGGSWKRGYTALREDQIKRYIDAVNDVEDNFITATRGPSPVMLLSETDQLPTLHAILLPSGHRWDAYNKFWAFDRFP